MSDARVTMSDIARHLGVTVAAVSNWRRRHSSFPRATTIGGKEWFEISAVANWLDGRKIAKDNLQPGELPGTTYGTRFRPAMGIQYASDDALDNLQLALFRFQGKEDVAVFADLVLEMVYLAASDVRTWNSVMAIDGQHRLGALELAAMEARPIRHGLRRAVGELATDPHAEQRLTGIVELVDRIRQSKRSAEIFQFLLDRFAADEGRRDATVHTPHALVRLLVELAGPRPGLRVHDPACGSGGFLVATMEYLREQGGATEGTSFTGHALSERLASLARMNLLLHDISGEVDAYADMIFRSGGQPIEGKRFDLILSNPPFDMMTPPPDRHSNISVGRHGIVLRSGSSFTWLWHIASALDSDGCAAVIMPGSSLFREGAEGQVRAELIDSGMVEAIIALPPGLFASTAIPVCVWFLRYPAEQRRNEILLIDAVDLGHLISRTQRNLSDGDRNQITDTVTRWRSGNEYRDVPGFSASVTVPRIREQDYVLTPARYVGRRDPVNAPSRSIGELRADLARLSRLAVVADDNVDRQLNRIDAWIR